MPISSQLNAPPSKETAGATDANWKLVYKPAVLTFLGNKLLIYKYDSGRHCTAVVRTVALQQKCSGFDSCSGFSLICMFPQCLCGFSPDLQVHKHKHYFSTSPSCVVSPSGGALASSWRPQQLQGRPQRRILGVVMFSLPLVFSCTVFSTASHEDLNDV